MKKRIKEIQEEFATLFKERV
jgi:hypothetical protein